MKLYTEEQVIEVFEKYGNMSAINARNIIDLSESIEVPSDEEIWKEAPFSSSTFGFEQGQYQGFLLGAKWIKDKILNK